MEQGLETELERIRLCVVTSIPFPYGMAATNRILSYSGGLVQLGESVTVLTSNFSTNKISSPYNGISFKAFRRNFKNRLLKPFELPIAVLEMVIFLWVQRKRFTHVLVVSNNPVLIVLTYVVSRLIKVVFLQEKSEFPFVLNNRSVLGRLYAKAYVGIIYKLFDGIIVMTNPLATYFQDKVKKSCKLVVIPMTVEPSRFANVTIDYRFAKCITYCGHMGGNKDGLINLINAFGRISKKYPDHKLMLIGTAKPEEILKLKETVKLLNVDNVWFFGKVDRDEMPKLLCSSKLLVLSRPSSLQSTGGFPTKLGEYLATGNPVVVTKVGDIPVYLNETQAFLVDPDDDIKFAEAMEKVLNDYDAAKKIGRNGKTLTDTTFNYLEQSKKIQKYLQSLR